MISKTSRRMHAYSHSFLALGALVVPVAMFAATLLVSPTPATATEPDAPILAEDSPWRYHPVWRTGVYREDDGGIEDNWRWTRRITPTTSPPDDWTEVDFDDTGWLRTRGPFFDGRIGPAEHLGHGHEEPTTIANIHLRGRFMVEDPSAVSRLRLSLAYRGGVVIYLNGEEVFRQHIGDGEIDETTLAEDYPLEASQPNPRWDNAEAAAVARQRRLREADGVSIPTDRLRRGVNVLAVRLHRSPYPPEAITKHTHLDAWATVGLHTLRLEAAPAGSVRINSQHPPHTQVWTASVTAEVGSQVAWADPSEPGGNILPIRLIAPRNATVSGQAVVSAPASPDSVSATVAAAAGPSGAMIGADAWRIRYAAKTTPEADFDAPRFDVLLDEPPGGTNIQPVWVTLTVPDDAAPGTYRTALRIEADGPDAPVAVPIELTVVDWDLPDASDWSSFASINHSPHAVAWQYGVEMWSPRHLELLAPSMELMAKLGNNVAFIDVIRPTFFANEHGIIVFREQDGRMAPDFRFFDAFLDAYAEHIGEPQKLVLYVWEPRLEGDDPAETVTLTRLNEDGSLSHFEHPTYGSDDGRELWREMTEGVKQHMLRRRWSEENVVLGVGHDRRPSERTVSFFNEIAPWAKWALFTHGRGDPRIRDDRLTIGDMEVGYLEYPYGHGRAGQRSSTMLGGWKDLEANIHKVYCGRGFVNEYSPLHNFRIYGDMSVSGSSQGFGRLGMDLWPVRRPGDNQSRRPVHGVGGWGNLYRGNPRSVAYPGPDGAVASIRFELLREGLQEAEARIFIEKALTDEQASAVLGDEIAERYADLSRRRLSHRNAGGDLRLGPGWQDRLEELYRLAAEVQTKLAEAGVR